MLNFLQKKSIGKIKRIEVENVEPIPVDRDKPQIEDFLTNFLKELDLRKNRD